MTNKKEARQRRARKTRAKIAEQKTVRLAINRTNQHIYAQVISAVAARFWQVLQRWKRKCAKKWRMAETQQLLQLLVSVLPKRLKVLALLQSRSIVPVTNTMVALKRWLMPRANMACSSKLR